MNYKLATDDSPLKGKQMRLKLTGLWRHADFLRLWSGQTISVFGSMIGGTALDFTAILVLGATLLSSAFLAIAQLGDGFFTVYQINVVSLWQTISEARLLGRVRVRVAYTRTKFLPILRGLCGNILRQHLKSRMAYVRKLI